MGRMEVRPKILILNIGLRYESYTPTIGGERNPVH